MRIPNAIDMILRMADASRSSLDPNIIPPDAQPSRWKRLLHKLSKRDSEPKPPPSNVRLTERNLTEFFNPDYKDEHDFFKPTEAYGFQGCRKISIPEWIQQLP